MRLLPFLPLVAACGVCPAVHDAPWTESAPLPIARIEAGVAAVGDQLVVIGGFIDGPSITTEVDVLNTLAPEEGWDAAAIPAFPEAWTHLQVAVIGLRIYVLGGMTGGLTGNDYVAEGRAYVLDTSEVDPAKRAWVPIAPLPAGFERGSAGVAVAKPRIYLLGGAGSSTVDPRPPAGALATNLYYDTETDTWGTDLPDLPAPRSHPAAAILDDATLVVAGGLATPFSVDATSETYWLPPALQGDPLVWIEKTPIPDKRGGCAYGTVGGRLLCAGGESQCNGVACALHTSWAYQPALDFAASGDDPWCRLAELPSDRAGSPGAVVGSRLFVPGGARRIAFEAEPSLLVYAPGDDPALEPIPDTETDPKLCSK